MNKIKNVVKNKFLPIGTGLLYFILSTGSAGAINGFYVTTSSPGVTTGGSFQAAVRLSSAAEVDTTHIVVSYPAGMLQVTGLSGGSEPYELPTISDASTPGTVVIERFSVTGAPAGITGDNLVATITFKALAQGTPQIGFANGTAAVRGGAVLSLPTAPTTIAISSPTQPTPSPPTPTTTPTPPTTTTTTTPSTSSTGTSSRTAATSSPTSSSGNKSTTQKQTTPSTSTPNSSNTSSPQTSQSSSGSDPASGSSSDGTQQVTLTFLDKNQQPLKDAQVSVNGLPTSKTNSKGQVAFSGLAPGNYSVVVSYKGHNYPTEFTVNEIAPAGGSSQKLSVNVLNPNTGIIQPGLALASLILSIAAIYIILGSQYLYEELVLRRSQQPHVRTVEQKTAANSLPSDKPSAFAISDAVAVPVLPSGAMVQPKHFEESDRTKFELPRRMYKFSSLNLLLASVLFAVLGTGAILTNHAQEKSPGLITIEQASRQVKQLDCTKVDKGDFNCDGKIDYLDVSALLIKVNSEDSKSDLNHNGKVDTADVTTVTKNLSR